MEVTYWTDFRKSQAEHLESLFKKLELHGWEAVNAESLDLLESQLELVEKQEIDPSLHGLLVHKLFEASSKGHCRPNKVWFEVFHKIKVEKAVCLANFQSVKNYERICCFQVQKVLDCLALLKTEPLVIGEKKYFWDKKIGYERVVEDTATGMGAVIDVLAWLRVEADGKPPKHLKCVIEIKTMNKSPYDALQVLYYQTVVAQKYDSWDEDTLSLLLYNSAEKVLTVAVPFNKANQKVGRKLQKLVKQVRSCNPRKTNVKEEVVTQCLT